MKNRKDPNRASKDDGVEFHRLAFEGVTGAPSPAGRPLSEETVRQRASRTSAPGSSLLPVADRPAQRDDPAVTLRELRAKNGSGLIGFLAAQIGSSCDDAAELAEKAYAQIEPFLTRESYDALSERLWKIGAALAREVQELNAAREARGEPIPPKYPPGSPEDLREKRRIQLIDEAVEQLPPKCRLAYILRVQEKRPFSDVARELGVDEYKAKYYLARALEYCSNYLDRFEKNTNQ